MRRAQRAYRTAPNVQVLALIFQSAMKLSADNECLKHENKNLEFTLREERCRRQRGKRLNLVGEEAGGAELYSP